MGNRIAVIIPYYQNKEGLLKRAVESVKNQVISEGIDLIVVDDSSPRPAGQELSDWDPGPGVRLKIIEQPNSGSGKARNVGINNIAYGIEYIAFLDSDDYWEENHLRFAMKAFDAGADLYFSDLLYEDNRKQLGHLEEMCNGLYELFDSGNSLWYSTGNALQMLIVYGQVQTTTVAYRYKQFKSIRFPHDFYRCGEDAAFWLQLAIGGARAIFSTNVEAFGGSGVNIFSDNVWGSVKQVHITSDAIRYRKHCIQSLSLCEEAIRLSREKLALARQAMMRQLLYHTRRGAISLCSKQILDDPLTLVYLPSIIMSILMKKQSSSP
jgi:succinoglycan biosynthesis protein ExoW